MTKAYGHGHFSTTYSGLPRTSNSSRWCNCNYCCLNGFFKCIFYKKACFIIKLLISWSTISNFVATYFSYLCFKSVFFSIFSFPPFSHSKSSFSHSFFSSYPSLCFFVFSALSFNLQVLVCLFAHVCWFLSLCISSFSILFSQFEMCFFPLSTPDAILKCPDSNFGPGGGGDPNLTGTGLQIVGKKIGTNVTS